jgi:son of sevenless
MLISIIPSDMQRFQESYNLLEIAEAQRYLTAAFGDLSKGNGNDLQDLYRRSLLVEPRQPNDQPDKGKDLFAWGRLGGSSS